MTKHIRLFILGVVLAVGIVWVLAKHTPRPILADGKPMPCAPTAPNCPGGNQPPR